MLAKRAAGAALALLVAVPAPVVAQVDRFNGVWASEEFGTCTPDPFSDNQPLRIRNGIIDGYESRCELTRPTDVRGMNATLYDAVCTGEGMRWTQRMLLMRGGPHQEGQSRLIIVQDGFATTYRSC